jgi:hypothetical protein
MHRCRLFAIDLDGTLVRDDGQIAAQDRKAIERLRASDVAVTLATGRLGPGALPIARSLELDTPLVCADGAVTICPLTAAVMDASPLAFRSIEALLAIATETGMHPYLFTPDEIWGPALELPFLGNWGPAVTPTDDLLEKAWGMPPPPVLAAIAFGTEARASAAARLAVVEVDDEETEAASFPMGGTPLWAVRLTPAGASKAAGLAALAQSMGITSDQTGAIGDWHNDVSMLGWAGHSFAMGHAPAEVATHARHHLAATSQAGGGVAEAVARLLDDGGPPR